MAVINVRVDDHIRDGLERLAIGEGLSLSEYIRTLLRQAVVQINGDVHNPQYGDQPAPESLSFMERKVLSMLHRILARVLTKADEDGEDGGRDHQLARARVLERGFTGEYWMEAAGFESELSKQDSWLVIEILEMFRVLNFSIRRLEEEGSAHVLHAETARALTYQGLDHNNSLEARMASYVKYLLDDGRWAELLPAYREHDHGNSHHQMLSAYTRMLSAYRRIMETRGPGYWDFHLSPGELAEIAESRRGRV